MNNLISAFVMFDFHNKAAFLLLHARMLWLWADKPCCPSFLWKRQKEKLTAGQGRPMVLKLILFSASRCWQVWRKWEWLYWVRANTLLAQYPASGSGWESLFTPAFLQQSVQALPGWTDIYRTMYGKVYKKYNQKNVCQNAGWWCCPAREQIVSCAF